jgi:mono/diheme cytochrome c family protein
MSSPFRALGWFMAAALLLGSAARLSAQAPLRPGRLSPEQIAALRPGLRFEYFPTAPEGAPLDVRPARLAALYVPRGAAATPLREAGPFALRASGYLKASLKGTYTLHVRSSHPITVRIGGDAHVLKHAGRRPIVASLPDIELARGYNPIEVTFINHDGAAAQWRIGWSSEEFAEEPLPPEMPRLLRGGEAEQAQAAADLAAYLASVGGDAPDLPPPPIAPSDEKITAGSHLFENLGCIACHTVRPTADEDPHARLSLQHAPAKFAPGALASFLQAPGRHYPWTRMPDFRLQREEAERLTHYLLAEGQDALPAGGKFPAGDAARGKLLYGTLGCNSCHGFDEPPRREGRNLVPIARNASAAACLAEDSPPTAKWPRYALSVEERAALVRFLETDRSSLGRDAPGEFAERQIRRLRCTACHRRDSASSVLSDVLQDEGIQGFTPEVLPALTWTGEKLQPAWTRRLLAGELDEQARPWLRARMPAFPSVAAHLSAGLSYEHGFALDEDPRPPHDAELAKIGARLAGDRDGFSCIKCHAVGKQPPLAPFEAPGINLVSAAQRLRYPYYPRWMLDPPRVDILTKMPKFAADGRTTAVSSPFDGDAARQFDALWHYLRTLAD